MPYFFDESDGVRIEVPKERWIWHAIYQDSEVLSQFDDASQRFHRIGEIEQERLDRMMLTDGQGKAIVIPWKQGMRLIHKYRNIVLDVFGDRKDYRIYIFGFKSGANHQYFYVMPDDTILASEDENLPLSSYI